MTTPRRLSGLSPMRLLSLIAVGIATAIGVYFSVVRFFFKSPTSSPAELRTSEDGLALSMLAILVGIYLYARPDTVRSAPQKRSRLNWRVMIPLAVLILAAAFLRFYKLDLQSLWYDELTTAEHVTGPDLYHAVIPGSRVLDSWPGYHVPLYLFVQLAGPSEFALRFPSTLLGVLLVPAVFVLGRRMYSDREGLIAAAFVVALNTAVYYDQEARMYGLLIALASLSGYFWLRMAQTFYWRQAPPRWMTLGLAATLVLMDYTHYYGLILTGIEGLGLIALMGSVRRISPAFITVFAAVGLTYLPWLPMFYQDLHNTTFLAAYRPDSLLATAREFAKFLPDDQGLLILFGLLCAAGVVLALWKVLLKRPREATPLLLSPAVLLGVWLLLPISIAYFRSLLATPIVLYRYFLVTLPAISVLVGRAVTRLPLARMAHSAIGLGLAIILTVNLFWSGYYVLPHTTQVREAARYVVSHDQQYHDSVIAVSMLGTIPQINYYFKKFDSDHMVDLKLSPPSVDDSRQRILDAHTRYVWFIGEDSFVNPLFMDALGQDYNVIDTQRFNAITVWLYERKTSGPTP